MEYKMYQDFRMQTCGEEIYFAHILSAWGYKVQEDFLQYFAGGEKLHLIVCKIQ